MIKADYAHNVNLTAMYEYESQSFYKIISKDYLIDGRYIRYGFEFGWGLFSDSKLNFQLFPLYFLAEEK